MSENVEYRWDEFRDWHKDEGISLENQAEVTRRASFDREIVAMICDNPEGPPHSLIGVWGDWVGPSSFDRKRRFRGANLLDCLRKAVAAKRKATL